MHLHYCATPSGNFGDDMNLWFWDYLLPNWQDYQPDRTMFGIGTLLSDKSLRQYEKILICGSGSGYGGLGKVRLDPNDIAWVRGPNTARLLGLNSQHAITDPACMVPEMKPFCEKIRHNDGIAFIPHRMTAMLDLNWDNLADRLGAKIILPQGEAKTVISSISNAELILAESMHGAIIADAFRIPWIPVRISYHFNDFKWLDWAASMEMQIEFCDALSEIRAAYIQLTQVKSKIKKSVFRNKPRNSAPEESIETYHSTIVEKKDRDLLKRNISRFSWAFEYALARGLKKAISSTPYLSKDSVLLDRRQRISDKIGTIKRQFGG